MKLNVGDLVELQFDGTTYSGVITSVTPERVELSFTLNYFLEGPGRLTWHDGADQDVVLGSNSLTKLHLRLPLEEVARAHAMAASKPAAPPAAAPPQPAPPAPPPPAAPPRPEPTTALEALVDNVDTAAHQPPPRERKGVWTEYEALVDGTDLETADGFAATTQMVSPGGLVLKVLGKAPAGDRLQLRFTFGKEPFDLTARVVFRAAEGELEVTYDDLPPEVRVRMLRAVLGLAKPELRTQESWTYQLRNKKGVE